MKVNIIQGETFTSIEVRLPLFNIVNTKNFRNTNVIFDLYDTYRPHKTGDVIMEKIINTFFDVVWDILDTSLPYDFNNNVGEILAKEHIKNEFHSKLIENLGNIKLSDFVEYLEKNEGWKNERTSKVISDRSESK